MWWGPWEECHMAQTTSGLISSHNWKSRDRVGSMFAGVSGVSFFLFCFLGYLPHLKSPSQQDCWQSATSSQDHIPPLPPLRKREPIFLSQHSRCECQGSLYTQSPCPSPLSTCQRPGNTRICLMTLGNWGLVAGESQHFRKYLGYCTKVILGCRKGGQVEMHADPSQDEWLSHLYE